MTARSTSSGEPKEFHIEMVDLFKAVDDMSDFVERVGREAPLEFSTMSNMRFCLHELVANTIEHGVFGSIVPEIRVTAIVNEDCVEMVYVDNSELFDTTNHEEISIEEKIRMGAQRGLGLFMLSKMLDHICYRRDVDRNHTLMKMKRDPEAPSESPEEDKAPSKNAEAVPEVA